MSAKTRVSRAAIDSDVVSAVPPFLDSMFNALRKRVPKAQQAQAEAFARAFYRRMSPEEYALHSPDAWAALAADFLDLARARKPGMAEVRVFNATLKQHGLESPHTVVQIVNDDMPFLVDSVTMALAEQGIGVHVFGHPVVEIQRDKAGRILSVGEGTPESMIHLEIDRQPVEAMPAIERAIQKGLADVRTIVSDWETMRSKMMEIADDLATRKMPVSDAGRAEAQEFLHWAAEGHFTFLGYREYEVLKKDGEELLTPVGKSGLGLLRGKDT
ncbi:MAG TPA: hypothetical protein VJ303_10825, partial [Steroidobacteraceae bacterium]|nr:hypothetical protein [Steroidobacteraceae bacterium]